MDLRKEVSGYSDELIFFVPSSALQDRMEFGVGGPGLAFEIWVFADLTGPAGA